MVREITDDTKRGMVRAAGAVSLATMISRVLGLVREQVLAAYFDVFSTDAFFVAFRIPNLLRDLFAEGALSAAFVPTFTDYLNNRGKEEAWRLASLFINALLAVLSVITLVFFLAAKYFVLILAAGFLEHAGKIALTTKLAQIMSPFLLFVALASVIMGMLNAHGKFFIPALAPAMFNLVNIAAGIFLSPLMPKFGQEPIVAMAIGSLLGSVGQLLIQIPSAYHKGFRYEAIVNYSHPGLRHITKLMLPATFGLAATQINVIIDNQFASSFGNGPVSWLNYAFRLMQLPIGIFGVAIATVNLAAVSRHAAQRNHEELKSTLARSVRLATALTIPAMAGLIALRYPIIEVLYKHRMFTAEYTLQTSSALLHYALGLSAYSFVKIIVPTFYALGDSKTPAIASTLTVGMKIVLNFILTAYLGFLGLALSTSLASWLNVLFLSYQLRRKIGGFQGYRVVSTAVKVTAAAVLMGTACFYFYSWIRPVLSPLSLMRNIFALFLSIVLGIGLLSIFGLLFRFWNDLTSHSR